MHANHSNDLWPQSWWRHKLLVFLPIMALAGHAQNNIRRSIAKVNFLERFFRYAMVIITVQLIIIYGYKVWYINQHYLGHNCFSILQLLSKKTTLTLDFHNLLRGSTIAKSNSWKHLFLAKSNSCLLETVLGNDGRKRLFFFLFTPDPQSARNWTLN